MISTRDLSGLPGIEEIVRLNQALATLDAILCPEWEFRYFSFNDQWDEDEKLGLMRNGEGDDWLIFIKSSGVVIKGFVHSCPMADDAPWPGLFDGVPEVFEGFLDEPAFSRDATTFCVWRQESDDGWRQGTAQPPPGEDPDGSAYLMSFLDGDPMTYKKWGDEYFGQPIQLAAIERIYRHVPLNPGLVASLNPEINFRELCQEVGEIIGYPVA